MFLKIVTLLIHKYNYIFWGVAPHDILQPELTDKVRGPVPVCCCFNASACWLKHYFDLVDKSLSNKKKKSNKYKYMATTYEFLFQKNV